LLGKGDGTFAAASRYVLPGEGLALSLGDLNDDGRVDMVRGDEANVNVVLNACPSR
jgi:hypothetical protein